MIGSLGHAAYAQSLIMPNILRRRRGLPREFIHEVYERTRLQEVEQERCPTCTDRWASSMMKTESDGIRRCPDCRLEPRTEVDKARIAAQDAERIGQKQTRPQPQTGMPLSGYTPPHIRVMERASGTRVIQSSPLVLVRSGSAVQLILKGGGFLSTDTFSYSTGVSNSVAPSLSGSTQWTLTLVASGAATPGVNHLTFNNHTYRGILEVG